MSYFSKMQELRKIVESGGPKELGEFIDNTYEEGRLDSIEILLFTIISLQAHVHPSQRKAFWDRMEDRAVDEQIREMFE